jgi:hypothetical protein
VHNLKLVLPVSPVSPAAAARGGKIGGGGGGVSPPAELKNSDIIDGRNRGTLSSGRCPYVACGLLPPSGRWERPPAPRGAHRKPGSGPVHSPTLAD